VRLIPARVNPSGGFSVRCPLLVILPTLEDVRTLALVVAVAFVLLIVQERRFTPVLLVSWVVFARQGSSF
jgi:hypothetical protein